MPLLDSYGRPLPSAEERADAERQDAWANRATGLGVWGQDKTKAAQYLPVWRVLDQELTSLMNGSDVAQKIVSKPVEEMFRRGFAIEAPNVGETEREAVREYATQHLDLETNFREGKRWGRLYGGALLIMGIDDGRMPWEPLDEDNIRSFHSLSLVDRRYSYVQSQYAAMGTTSKYGRAQVYLISNAVAGYGWDQYAAQKIQPASADNLIKQGAQVVLVHESRVVRFDGNAADVVTRQNLAGWTWSVLQVVYDAMRQFEGAFDAACYLLSDASQGVFKLQGLMKAIASGQRANFAMRLQMLEQTRSVMHGIALDAGDGAGRPSEEFTRVPTPFGGIPELLDKMMLRMASAADMPATELWGRAPAGLNATGESDTRKWYARISAEQENELGPQLKRVFRLLGKARMGPLKGRDCKWTIKFRPLWAPTDKELSETRVNNANRDVAYINAGVVKPEEVALDLSDVYPNLDIEGREKALKAGLVFDPYANEPAPIVSAAIAGKTEGEPLSSKAPVSLYGTSGTQITKGALPAVAAAEQMSAASRGEQAPTAEEASVKSTQLDIPQGGKRGSDDVVQPTPMTEGAEKDARRTAATGASDHADAAPLAAIVIVWRAPGYVLTVSRPEPSREMAIPGGHVDPGESVVHAAARELLEECGIVVRQLQRHGEVLAAPGVEIFTAGKWEGVPRAAESGTRVAWMTPAELVEQAELFAPALREMAEAGLLHPPKAFGGATPARSAAIASTSDAGVLATLDALLALRDDAAAARDVFTCLLGDYRDVLRQDADSEAKRVYQQLSEDYPTRLLGWVLSAHWKGPIEIPTEDIDSSNRARWTASTDGKLESFKDKLRDGTRKPAVVVRVPDNPKLTIVDGHHRFLASEALGIPLLGYVAEMHVSLGPWSTLHDAQRSGRSGPSYQGPSWQQANLPGTETREP